MDFTNREQFSEVSGNLRKLADVIDSYLNVVQFAPLPHERWLALKVIKTLVNLWI